MKKLNWRDMLIGLAVGVFFGATIKELLAKLGINF
jgi:uncharacterized membrane-anchored protein YhcB (DUF1043 family)